MKKIKFLLGILTIAASTSLLSSCFGDPTFDEKPEVTLPSAETTYTITVKTNPADAKLTYNGKPVDKTFTTKENGELVVSADDSYVAQTINVVLGENKNIVLDVTLIKKPTSNTSVADAEASTSETEVNGNNNSSIVIPAGITQTNESVSDDAKFGIGVYNVVAVTEEPKVTEDKVENDKPHDVLVAVCEPDGARFDEPVTISVAAQNAEGLSFECTNDKEGDPAESISVGQNTLSAKVDHFSNWTFSLMARVIKIEEQEEVLFDGDILIHAGSNAFNYTAKAGVSSNRNGIAETFLISQFGSKLTNVAKTGTLSSTGEGSARIRVIQTKKIITYKSGNTQFTATVYGAIRVDVLNVTYDTTGHSGGIGTN